VTRASVAALLLTVVGAGACGGEDERTTATTKPRPTTTVARRDCAPGVHEFTLRNGQRVDMRVTRPGKRPYALVVALHGSGGTPDGAIEAFAGAWDTPGLVFVAPASKGPTWSVVTGGQDIDLQSVDLAVAETWARCPLAHDRLALGGFSDGATYALTLGVANGDLFPAIVALSPGGILAETRRGRPRIFVSHGTEDDVLPIAGASDMIVPALRSAGYEVTYRRFRGGHEVPPAASAAAVRWFLEGLD
jgi:phospholipase/carboxylesterase